MNTKCNLFEKCTYNAPKIECIKLDNEISLQLQSSEAPDDPEASMTPEYLNNNPFKNNMG